MNDRDLLKQKSLVESFLNQGQRPLSSFSFVSIFAWGCFFDFDIQMINGRLCILARQAGACFLYLPPLGEGPDPAMIQAAFAQMSGSKPLKPFNRIENIPENLLSAFSQDRYNQYSKPPEYVYRKEDLVALKGNAYKSQRHDCNCFVKRYAAHSFEPYKDADLGACMELYERWASRREGQSRDEIYKSMLLENRQVHERLLKFWEALGLVVRVLKADGKIIGYTFGFGLDADTFCIYAEIAEPGFTGAAAFLFKCFCEDEKLQEFNRINTMDDFAMPLVARAKQAYHPLELIPSYTVSLKA